MAQAQEKCGDLTKYKVRVKRYGDGQKSFYAIDVLDQISPAHLKDIEKLSLNLLEQRVERPVKNYAPHTSKDTDDEFGAPPYEIDDADRLPF